MADALVGRKGFEYWADQNDRAAGVITWQADGQQTQKITAGAVGPDPLPNGTGVSQRLIPEEPMSIVLNLGISRACFFLYTVDVWSLFGVY